MVDTQTLQFKKVPIDTTEETSSILSITASKFNLWVSGLNGVWRTELNKQFYSFSSLEDQFKKKKFYVYQVSVDHKNAVWLATDGQTRNTNTH